MTFGKNGFFSSICDATTSPMTTSSPSRKPSALTAILDPSDIPVVTATGLIKLPDFSQSIRCEFFCPGALAALPSPGGSIKLLLRASGATSASEDGDQRSAALGTSKALL